MLAQKGGPAIRLFHWASVLTRFVHESTTKHSACNTSMTKAIPTRAVVLTTLRTGLWRACLEDFDKAITHGRHQNGDGDINDKSATRMAAPSIASEYASLSLPSQPSKRLETAVRSNGDFLLFSSTLLPSVSKRSRVADNFSLKEIFRSVWDSLCAERPGQWGASPRNTL